MGGSSLWGLPAGAGRTMTCMVTTVSAFSSPIDGRKSACRSQTVHAWMTVIMRLQHEITKLRS